MLHAQRPAIPRKRHVDPLRHQPSRRRLALHASLSGIDCGFDFAFDFIHALANFALLLLRSGLEPFGDLRQDAALAAHPAITEGAILVFAGELRRFFVKRVQQFADGSVHCCR